MNSNRLALRRFVVSRFLGTLSDQFLLFAVPLAIFQSTGSVKYSGLAFVIEWLPRIVFFPLGGFVADRMKPRHLFFGVELGRALVLAVASILMATGVASTFAVLAPMMALLSVAYILNFVATEAMLPRNLTADELPHAHSVLQGIDQITQVAGPALAAAIAVLGGTDSLLIVGAALFGLSSLNLLSLRTAPVAAAERLSLQALKDSNATAIKVLLRNRVLFLLSGLTWVVNLVYGSALVLSAPIVVKTFVLPESHFGALQTVAALTSIGVFWFVPRFVRRFGLAKLGAWSFWAMIFAGLGLAVSGRYEAYLVAYAMLMAFDGVFSVYIRTVRSQIIPQEHLGKTTGFIGLMNMCSIPMSGLVVTLLSPTRTPFEILGVMFATAFVAGLALVVAGKLIFGYGTLLPSHAPQPAPRSLLAQESA
jgi:MFS family permease